MGKIKIETNELEFGKRVIFFIFTPKIMKITPLF